MGYTKVPTYFLLAICFRWKYGDDGKVMLNDEGVHNCTMEVTLREGWRGS